jgi:hypothetical protein
MTVQYVGDHPQRFIPERIMTNQTLHASIIYGDISGGVGGRNGRFNAVSLGREFPRDISIYRYNSDQDPFTGILVFEMPTAAFDDQDTALVMSFVLYHDVVLYDLRELM